MIAPVKQPLLASDPSSVISTPAWLQFYQQLVDRYTRVEQWTDPYSKTFGQIEPPNPPVGLIAYADGVSWLPNHVGAAGYWYWSGAAWVPIA